MKRIIFIISVLFLSILVSCTGPKYTVKYISAGEILSEIVVEEGSKLEKPNDPTREGYVFDGWYIDGEEWSFVGYVVTSDISLEAKWIIKEFKVSFVTNGGSEINDQIIKYGEIITVEPPIKEGYVFVGWFTDIDLNNKYDIELPVNSDLTLYAKYSVEKLKIEFENIDYEDLMVKYNDNLSNLESPKKTNFVFLGWFTDSEFQNAYDIDLPVQTDLVLYAKWKELIWTFEGRKTELKEGYVSLENLNSNGPIDEAGYYEVAGEKIKTKNIFKTIYVTEPQYARYNYLVNTWTYNSDVYANMVDGLVENDKYGNIIGSLAVGYKCVQNKNGTETWTFQLKEGVAWINNSGELYGEVVADDFVSSIKYILNRQNKAETASYITSFIQGSAEYYDNLYKNQPYDFSSVGVKALSKYEIEYTLYQSTPFFLTCLSHSSFLPVSQKYLDEIGSEFGKSEDNILINGPFRITEHILDDRIVYKRNYLYHDVEHVYVGTVESYYYDQFTDEALYKWYEKEKIDKLTINESELALLNKYGTAGLVNVSLEYDDATYIGFYNFKRENYEYTNNLLVKTDAEKAATFMALQNKNFRKGVLYGLDVMQSIKYYNSDSPESWLSRGFTSRGIVYNNNKDYADYVDEVFNEKQGTSNVSLTGIINGSDPIYNAEKASKFFANAKAELINAGLKESDFPIKVNVIGTMSERKALYEEAMYNSLEAAGAGVIDIQINYPTSMDQDTKWGSIINNYDFSMWSGWGADYQDPQTYLETVAIGGMLTDSMGLTGYDFESTELQKAILGKYTDLFNKGKNITDIARLDERYRAFAEAEYALIYEEAIIVPWLSQNGVKYEVTKVVPNQQGYVSYGLSSAKFKNIIVSNEPISLELQLKILVEYELNKNN